LRAGGSYFADLICFEVTCPEEEKLLVSSAFDADENPRASSQAYMIHGTWLAGAVNEPCLLSLLSIDERKVLEERTLDAFLMPGMNDA
jgi:hypothetical protein